MQLLLTPENTGSGPAISNFYWNVYLLLTLEKTNRQRKRDREKCKKGLNMTLCVIQNFWFQVVFLAQYLLQNFNRDQRVTNLVNNTDIWLMPSLNPDGFEMASEGNCYQVLFYLFFDIILKYFITKASLVSCWRISLQFNGPFDGKLFAFPMLHSMAFYAS